METPKSPRIWGHTALGLALLLTAPAYAQATEDEEGRIEEVVVTATYRETNLMDTPQAISAVTDTLVEDLGGQSMEDIYTMVPGLSMQGGLVGENRFTVRGVSSQTGGTGYFLTGATIGVYLDGTPVTAALGPDNQVSGTLFDIERVEILKGPQGTLFGEGSQGGTIRYLYKQPDASGFDAAVNVGYASMAESSEKSQRIDAMLNVPLADSLALRLTGWNAETAGYIDNVLPTGTIIAEDYNPAAREGVRAALRYEGDGFAVAGTVYSSTQRTEGSVQTLRAYEASAPSIEGFAPVSNDEIDIYSLVVEYDFDWADFQSMTSFTERQIPSVVNATYAGMWVLDFVYGGSTEAADHPGCTPAISFGYCPGWPGFFNLAVPGSVIADGMNIAAFVGLGNSYSERWVQEFRLVSPGDQRMRWTVGAFWKDSEDHSQNQQVAEYASGREGFGLFFDPLLQVPANTHTDLLEEYAVFGELSYDLTETVEVTVGLRISDMEQYFSNTDSGTDDTPVSPKFVVSWRPMDELLVYFNYATGFRPGNVNNHMQFNYRQLGIQIDQATAAGATADSIALLRQGQELSLAHRFFDGDHVASYEVGVKTTLWDGRAQLLASAYYLDWSEMILVEDVPELRALTPGTSIYNTNSGGAEIQGAELEASAFLTERLAVRLAADVVDSEVTQGPAQSTYSPEGAELAYAPGTSASLAVDYTIPLAAGWNAVLHADHAYVAEQFFNTENTVTIPSYEKTNARITLRSADTKWRIAAYATNLSNDEILRGRTALEVYYWFPPRQFGLEVGYNR